MTSGPDDPLRHLHERILVGDRTALEALTEILLATLPRTLRRHPFAIAQPEAAVDAVADAVLEYWRCPGRFDPSRCSLAGYIRHVAFRNLQDAGRVRARLAAHEESHPHDTIAGLAGMPPIHDPWREERAILHRTARAVCSDREYAAFRLRMNGERSTKVLAAALGFGHLSAEEQKLAVHRFKVRMTRYLLRHLGSRPSKG